MKDQNFFEEDWDYAIILDSARYDVFKEIYDDYFEGELEKRHTGASATPEWVEKKFDKRQNINWFSTNPFINGKNIKLNQFDFIPQRYGTNPTRHIAHVVDVWDGCWDDELGTVRPEDLNEEFRKRKDDLAERRTVIHYMQPHKPFLSQGGSRIEKLKKNKMMKIDEGKNSYLPQSVRNRFSGIVGKLEDSEIAMKLGFTMSLNKREFLEVMIGDTSEKMEKHHRENMREALESARELAHELDGKVIITSDHGEALGEEGIWEHHIETHIPPLVEVPWLEVSAAK